MAKKVKKLGSSKKGSRKKKIPVYRGHTADKKGIRLSRRETKRI